MRSRRLFQTPRGKPLFSLTLADTSGSETLRSGELCLQSPQGRPSFTIKAGTHSARRKKRR